MVSGMPMFPGTGEIDTLTRIFQLLGPPPSSWLDGVDAVKKKVGLSRISPHAQWRQVFPLMGLGRGGLGLTAQGLDLLTLLLSPDPATRVTADRALAHAYLTAEAPRPTLEGDMPTFKARHEK
eukprot:gene47239-biopygen37784